MSAIQDFEKMLDDMPSGDVKLPTNTIAHIFKSDRKENFISDWLAFLLDPACTGTYEPLQELILLAIGKNVDLSHCTDVEINREYVFDDGRRIDFLIKADEQIIAIENKVDSGFQDNQLEDYSEELKKISQDAIKILLCPQSNMAVRDTTDLFKVVTYEALIEKFKTITIDLIKNIRAAVLMQDFITHIEEYIMSNNSNEINFDMINFFSYNAKKINKLNNELAKCKEGVWNAIRGRVDELKAEFNTEHPDTWETQGGSGYYQIYKNSWKSLSIHFEIVGSILGGFKVTTHTQEGSAKGKSGLKELNEYGKTSLTISSLEDIDKMIVRLKELINEKTADIDTAISQINKTE